MSKPFLFLSSLLFLLAFSMATVAVGTYPALDESMVLYYHFNNDSAYGENDTNVYDFSGNGNNGTVVNAVWNSTGGYLGDGAFNYNVNSNISVNNKTEFYLNNNMTISLWYYNYNNSQT